MTNFHLEEETQVFYPDEHSQTDSLIREGMRVKHPSFGRGIIKVVEGEGDAIKLTVLFEGQSVRKFIAKYAKLEYLG
jgi:DNA helicase-2/ATP-dependent DNA helicase PcrA